MNSAYELPAEDREEFEQVLEEALRTYRLSTGADEQRLTELRAEALRMLPALAAAAQSEYSRFDRLRRRYGAAPGTPALPRALRSASTEERSGGPGVLAAVFALVPVLSTVTALVFLTVGDGLGLTDAEPALAAPRRQAGWAFAAMAAMGVVVAVIALVVAAVRNSSATAIRAQRPVEEIARAREEWRRALYDHGIMPFLRAHGAPRDGHASRRTPRLRFSSPEFTSPDFSSHPDESAEPRQALRPRYTHPSFSGPEFLRPAFSSPAETGADDDSETKPLPGPRGELGYAPPDYSAPQYDGPEFGSPRAHGGRSGRGPGSAQPDDDSPDFTSPAEEDSDPE